jgi:hypothetical protein
VYLSHEVIWTSAQRRGFETAFWFILIAFIGVVRLFQGRSRLKDGFVGLDGGVPLGTEGTPPFEDCLKRVTEVLGVIFAV